jgi:alpha-1,6-mannosyltransferase
MFGLHVNLIAVPRVIALVLLPVALVVIAWRTRRGNPLEGAALALLTMIFLAPITQPWYLLWALALYAATTTPIRWLLGTVVVSMFTVMPAGETALKFVEIPLAFGMCWLCWWVGRRSVRWLREPEPVLATPVAQPQVAGAVVE